MPIGTTRKLADDQVALAGPGLDEAAAVRPTIFIGLGGTGCEVLLRLRRKFFEQTLSASREGVAYRYIDCDKGFEKKALADTRALPVQEEIRFEKDTEKVLATVPSEYMDKVKYFGAQYGHITEWLNTKSLPASVEEGAGASRPIGRLTFFCNFNKITESITAAYNGLCTATEGATRAVTGTPRFVVIASLAGGTGSGLFLDLGFWLRKAFPGSPLIEGVFVLPDAFKGLDKDDKEAVKEKQRYMNGYAALKELEFFHQRKDFAAGSHAGPSPYDFRARWQGLDEQPGEPEAIPSPAYVKAWLIGGTNKEGVQIGGREENLKGLMEMIAEYLYWDVVETPFSNTLRGIRVDGFRAAQQELFDVPYHRDAGGGPPLRKESFSLRYMTMGVTKVCLPLPRIRFLCAYHLAAQMIDHWLKENAQGSDSREQIVKTLAMPAPRGIAYSADGLAGRVATDGDKTLDQKADDKRKEVQRPIRGGVPKDLLEKGCAQIAAFAAREERTDEKTWGHAPVVMLGRGGTQIEQRQRLWEDISKWVSGLVAQPAYGPERTRRILGVLADYFDEEAAKFRTKAKQAGDEADAEDRNVARTIGYYGSALGWGTYNPLRQRTLNRLAERALRQAAAAARKRILKLARGACSDIVAAAARSLRERQKLLQSLLDFLKNEKGLLEEQRDALDAMQADYFFEIDLYSRGDYLQYYSLGQSVEDLMDQFLRKTNMTTETLAETAATQGPGSLGAKLFAFGRELFRKPGDVKQQEIDAARKEGRQVQADLLEGKAQDAVAALFNRYPNGLWQSELMKKLTNGRPWLKPGNRDCGSSRKVISKRVAGWVYKAATTHQDLKKWLESQSAGTKMTFQDCGDPGCVVTVEEQTFFPMTYSEAIADLDAAYRNEAPKKTLLGGWHTQPAFAALPSVVAKQDAEVFEEIRCRELIFKAVVLRSIERGPADSQKGATGRRLTFHYRDMGIPKSPPFDDEDDMTAELLRDAALKAHLERSVAAADCCDDKRREQLLKILWMYQTRTFAKPDGDGAATVAKQAAIDSAAAEAWYKDTYTAMGDDVKKMAWIEKLGPNDLPPDLATFAEDLGGGHWAFKKRPV